MRKREGWNYNEASQEERKRPLEENIPEVQARREAYYNRQCLCGHKFGNHSISGCMHGNCSCSGIQEKLRTVEYTKLSNPDD